MLIELENVTKIYNRGNPNEVTALHAVSLQVRQGSMVCLQGASGSGKSTLLAIIGCVFPPTSGRAAIAGKQLSRMPDRFLTKHRRETIGFIFQQFNILPRLSVLDNITLPLLPLGVSPAERKKRARKLMEQLAMVTRSIFRPGRSPAVKCSGSQSPGPSSTTNPLSWQMNRPPTWTATSALSSCR
jgi:putative ABC transport system ATP-binding protein